MTLIAKSTNEDVISLPAKLMQKLGLQEGDEIKTVIDGSTLRIAPLERFLALRGVLADDNGFSAGLEMAEQAWIEWQNENSA